MWAVYDFEEVHVVPLNDTAAHFTDCPWCGCHPKIEPYERKPIVIHNAYDGREITERALVDAMKGVN
jgi:hypothetical protein